MSLDSQNPDCANIFYIQILLLNLKDTWEQIDSYVMVYTENSASWAHTVFFHSSFSLTA